MRRAGLNNLEGRLPVAGNIRRKNDYAATLERAHGRVKRNGTGDDRQIPKWKYDECICRNPEAPLRIMQLLLAELGPEVGGDLLPVKTSVLDENLAGAGAGNDDTGDIDTGHIAFQSFRV